MNKLRLRLVSLGVARQFDVLTNEISPVSGTGRVLIQLDGTKLKAWVSEEPEAANATKVFGSPVVTSTDATIAPDENAARLLQQENDETVFFVAQVLEILQVQSVPSRAFPHYWLVADCSVGVTLSLNTPDIETLAVGDVVRGTGVLGLRIFSPPSPGRG